MNRQEIHFNSHGPSGNIYCIMAAVREALRKERRISEWNDLYQAVTSSGSYEEALCLLREKINLIDDDGIY